MGYKGVAPSFAWWDKENRALIFCLLMIMITINCDIFHINYRISGLCTAGFINVCTVFIFVENCS